MRLASVIAAVAIALLAAPSAPKSSDSGGPLWREVFPRDSFKPRDPTPVVVVGENATVTVRPPPPRPDGKASWDDAGIVVQFPGLPPYAVPRDEERESAFGIWVGIGKMAEADRMPTVLIAGYTGGMHCCATLQTVSLVEGRPVSAILPTKDGEPIDAFPQDIDGDGMRDIRWSDDSLLYVFTSYAASRSVPRIYHLQRGELLDVSRAPSFAPLLDDFANETLSYCRENQGGENAGACAAYAYAMALRGRAEEGIGVAASLTTKPTWPADTCAGEPEKELCTARRAYPGFEDKLREKMRRDGYLPS